MEKLLVLLSLVGVCLSTGDIDYSDQANWGGSCNTGNMQSPIDVNYAHKTVHYTAGFPAFGADVSVTFDGAKYVIADDTPVIHMPENWPVGHTNGLKLLQLHLHWGEDSTHGAEHHLFGDQHAGEVHLVMRNLDQNDENSDDYYSVFGMFLDELPSDADQNVLDEGLTAIMEGIGNSPNAADSLVTIDLSKFYDTSNEVVYTYEGSLTTPTCTEHVFWHVFDKAVLVGAEKMARLRTEYSSTSTNRDTQHLNNREITQRLLGQRFDDSEYDEHTNDSSNLNEDPEDNETDDDPAEHENESMPDHYADGCEYDNAMNIYKCYYGSATSFVLSSVLGVAATLALLL